MDTEIHVSHNGTPSPDGVDEQKIKSNTVSETKRAKHSKQHYDHNTPIYANMLKKSRIVTIADLDTADKLFANINNSIRSENETRSNARVFAGFDLEWSTNKSTHKKVALIQISVRDFEDQNTVNTFLIRTTMLMDKQHSDYSDNSLIKFLENPKIYKVGVEVHHDKNKLMNDFGIHVSGVVDLRHIHQRFNHKIATLVDDTLESDSSNNNLQDDNNQEQVNDQEQMTDVLSDSTSQHDELEKLKLKYAPQLSLGSLTKRFCGFDMPKPFKIRCGDWNSESLSHEQILYASADSFYALEIVHSMLRDIELSDGSFAGLVDVHFKVRSKTTRQLDEKPTTHVLDKEERRRLAHKPTSAGTIYDNNKFVDSSDNFMFYCSNDKAEWYLIKGLAVKIDEKTFRLTFTPKGKGNQNDEYMTNAFKNICVKCGGETNIMHHYVVPYALRKGYPEQFKSHSHVDIVVMCLDCKMKISDAYSRRLVSLLESFGVARSTKMSTDMKRVFGIVGKFNTLIKHLKRELSLPKDKVDVIVNELKEYIPNNTDVLNVNSLSIETLENIVSQIKQNQIDNQIKTEPSPFDVFIERWMSPHKVTDHPGVLSDKIHELNKLWRQFFLDVAQPRYLPTGWSIDYRKEVN